MALRLRNTLTRRIETVSPLEPGWVRMYTCGPTVYRYAHVGNLRSYLLADLIRRALLYHGIEVLHVKNVTDVGHLRDERFDRGEDRMLVAAGLEGRSPAEIARAYEASFHEDEARVNVLPAHVFPRATDHMGEMTALIERLEDAGYAYATADGTVYFDVSSFAGYGRLSGNSLADLRAGHRGEVEPDKRDPADFALWKAAGEGRILKWPTRRWGEGFPGWHVECSAMSMRYLGSQFDIHTGGIDNVFPHHEDEIAQSAALTGLAPARMWVHGEHLLMDGHKMAKSAGNFVRVTALAEVGIDPLAFRYLALTARYSHKLSLSDESLRGAQAALASLRSRLLALGPPPASGPWAAPRALEAGRAGDLPIGRVSRTIGHQAGWDRIVHGQEDRGSEVGLHDRAHSPTPPLTPEGRSLHERFVEALDDDLDLPVALAVARETLRAAIPDDEKRWLVLDADFILGLDLHRTWGSGEATDQGGDDLPDEIARLLRERAAARSVHDYARADALRARLQELGVEVTDRSDGETAWRRVVRS